MEEEAAAEVVEAVAAAAGSNQCKAIVPNRLYANGWGQPFYSAEQRLSS